MIPSACTTATTIWCQPMKGKQLTNMRASGSDEAVILTPPIQLTLERALEFIEDDELVEVTPHPPAAVQAYLNEKRAQTRGSRRS